MANTAEDIKNLTQKAEAGDASAQNSLGCAYHNADGVECDYAKAYHLFQAAAKKGNNYAINNIGIMYQYGQFVEKDLLLAFKMYVKSIYSSQWSGDSNKFAYKLGMSFLNGTDGFPKIPEIAFIWLKEGARVENNEAKKELASMLIDGIGCKQNEALGKSYLPILYSQECENREEFLYFTSCCDKLFSWGFTSPLIRNNPYRTLGLYTSDTEKTVRSNLSRIKAFSSVGKLCKFVQDTPLLNIWINSATLEGQTIDYNAVFENAGKATAADVHAKKVLRGEIEHLYSEVSKRHKSIKAERELSKEEEEEWKQITAKLRQEEKEFPLTAVSSLLPNRSTDVINLALQKLEDNKERLKYAFFWFSDYTEEDHKALQLISEGKIQKGLDVWKDRKDFSSIHNLAVVAFIKIIPFVYYHDTEEFLKLIVPILQDNQLRKAFVSSVCGENFSISKDEFIQLFVDALMEAHPDMDWWNIFKYSKAISGYEDYVANKYATQYRSRIEDAFKVSSDTSTSDSYYAELSKSVYMSASLLFELERLFGRKDYNYQRLSDIMAGNMISLSQKYFALYSSSDYNVTKRCVDLTDYAYEIAYSSAHKEKIHPLLENIKDLQKKLPPKPAYEATIKIRQFLERVKSQEQTAENALKLIDNCVPYLLKIKVALGRKDTFYLSLSTDIANKALDMAVTNYNKELNKSPMITARRIYLPPGVVMDWDGLLHDVRACLSICFQLFSNIDVMDLDDVFRDNKYCHNKDILREGADRFSVSTSYTPTIDMTTEEDIFSKAITIVQLQAYLSNYGHEKAQFYVQACSKIKALEKADDEYWDNTVRCSDYMLYLKKYPDGLHSKVAKQIIDRIKAEEDNKFWEVSKPHKAYKAYLSKYPNGIHANEAKEFLQRRDSVVEPIKDIVAAIVFVAAFILTLYFTF